MESIRSRSVGQKMLGVQAWSWPADNVLTGLRYIIASCSHVDGVSPVMLADTRKVDGKSVVGSIEPEFILSLYCSVATE